MTHSINFKKVRTTNSFEIGRELEEINVLINDIVHFVDDIKHDNNDEIVKIAELIQKDLESGPLAKIKAIVTSYTIK